MAEALGIGQMQISRLEKRRDPRLSTIERTVAAMGGHLTVIATFPIRSRLSWSLLRPPRPRQPPPKRNGEGDFLGVGWKQITCHRNESPSRRSM